MAIKIYFFPDAPAGGGTPPATPPATPPVSDWRASLPAELKDSPTIKDIKSVDDLVKGYIHAQKSIGNNVAIPGKDAKPEDWGNFFNKVGRPESAEKYDFGKVEGEEQAALTPEVKSAYMKMAHDAGLTNRQAAQLYTWYTGTAAKGAADHAAAVTASVEKAVSTLKAEWGGAYEQNLDIAKAALREFGGDEAVKLMEETGLGNDVRVVKMFQKIGRSMAEGKLFDQGKPSNFKHTPAEAEAMIGQKMNDKNFMEAYVNAEHPGHAAAVKEMQDLYSAKNPK